MVGEPMVHVVKESGGKYLLANQEIVVQIGSAAARRKNLATAASRGTNVVKHESRSAAKDSFAAKAQVRA